MDYDHWGARKMGYLKGEDGSSLENVTIFTIRLNGYFLIKRGV